MSKPDSCQHPDRSDYQEALRSLDTFVDISVDDLMEVTQRAEQISRRRSLETLQVRAIMSRSPQCVYPHTRLAEAARLLVRERISGLPVIDERQRLVGLITEADFLRALGVSSGAGDDGGERSVWGTLESLFDHLRHHGELSTSTDVVEQHMSRKVHSVPPDESVETVIAMLKAQGIKRVVVCAADRRVLGMVTRSDLIRVFFERLS